MGPLRRSGVVPRPRQMPTLVLARPSGQVGSRRERMAARRRLDRDRRLDGGPRLARTTCLPARHGAGLRFQAPAVPVSRDGARTGSAGPAEAACVANNANGPSGWRGVVFPGVFLVYLVQVGAGVAQYSRGLRAVLAMCIVGGLLRLLPVRRLPEGWQEDSRRFWPLYGALVVLCALELPFARADAFVMCVFIVVLSVARLGGRAAPIVVALALIAAFVPWLFPSWHDNLAPSVDNGDGDLDPHGRPGHVRLFQRDPRQPRPRRGARRNWRASRLRTSGPAIARDLHDLARPLAHDDHGESRPCPPAGRDRPVRALCRR